MVDAVSVMEPIYQQLPELRLIPLAAKGILILGVPIGTKDYVNNAIRKEIADCKQQCQKLVSFPFANCFILVTRYCCNWKVNNGNLSILAETYLH